jgi:hypothetical protein
LPHISPFVDNAGMSSLTIHRALVLAAVTAAGTVLLAARASVITPLSRWAFRRAS